MHFVYLIRSKSTPSKIYIGFTHDISKRLVEHNSDENTGYTRKYRPWEIIYIEGYAFKQSAIIREKQLKKHGNTTVKLKLRLGL